MKSIFVLFLSVFAGVQLIKAQDTDTVRLVPVTGAVNFRDLGGYATKQGTHVKWGKLFRSGELSKLTDEDLLLLDKKHLDYVVDFRGNEEVAKAKDRLPAGAGYLQLPAGSENMGSWMSQLPKLNSADSLMISSYSQTAHLKAKYQPFFKELLALPDTSALLFHCAAGKDRTGIGAALLLHVLGVPEQVILTDYLASNGYRKEENKRMISGMVQMGIKEQVAEDLASVKKEYLEATYAALVKKYGSVDKFITNELGLTKADQKLLRKKYTN